MVQASTESNASINDTHLREKALHIVTGLEICRYFWLPMDGLTDLTGGGGRRRRRRRGGGKYMCQFDTENNTVM
jgi:hypothetical protein